MIKESNNIPTAGLTLGSLFDGIGAAPLAASFFGIEPIWASEILPNAVSVTKRHFPAMEHLGDITKLDGGAIQPVRVLCFGSPCQSWSVAGTRSGFDGKSGLFNEAIRIIKEMRCATNGKFPEIVCFENVVGLLNCNAGRDYQTVLEAFTEGEVPMPESGRWANAGMVRGRGLNLAWAVKNAQHYRVAQRRRRLFVVVDFAGTGNRAAEILFESKSLSGYFAARELARQGTAADAESGAESAGCGINGDVAGTLDANYGKGTGMRGGVERDVVLCAATGQSNAEILRDTAPTLNCSCEQPIVCAEKNMEFAGAFMAGQAKNARSIAYNERVSPTLKGAASGLNQTPSVLCVASGQADSSVAACENVAPTLTLHHEAPYICKEQTAYGICSQSSNSMLSDNPYSGVYEADTCKTLDTTCANPACNQGGVCIVEPQIARTLTARHDSSPCADRGQNIVAIHQNQQGELRESDVAYTLGTNANATGRNAPLIAFAQNTRDEVRDLNDVAGCLAASPGMKQQTYVAVPEQNCLTPWDSQESRVFTPDSLAPTLAGADMGGGRNPAGLVMTEVHPDVAGTLLGSGAGLSRPAGHCGETDLAVAYPAFCLQGNMIGRADHNGPAGGGVNAEVSFTLNATDKHAVAAVDCRNLYETAETSGTLTAKETGGYSLNYVNPVRTGYVIRRLTPTECERLMAFPDGYTACGHDGKEMSDSVRYSMLGNSIVVNVLAYIMQNIADKLTARSFSDVTLSHLSGEDYAHYALLLQTKGARQYLANPFGDTNWLPYVSSYYGYRIHPISGVKDLHRGVDVALPQGTPIQSGQDGTVTFAGYSGDYGNVVVIEDDKGLVSKYAHCDTISVAVGQTVKIGDVIATVGTTGNSTGPHLHLEIIKNGQYLNALYFCDSGSFSLTPTYGYAGSPMGDGTYAALIAEAEKYLGFPYVWGGSSPSTSFDCSGFVSYVLVHSGVKNVGRLGATGLYNVCTPVSPAEARPGDLIFFQGTYSTPNPVSHVGIYVGLEPGTGRARMLHCGNPIQYTYIDTAYWQNHFFAFGRVG